MNRTDLQKIADTRVTDANVLLDASRFEGAYYLAGYALECALKSCIAKQIREHDFPDRKLVNDAYVHNLEKLLNISGVKQLHQDELKSNAEFESNWTIVKDWSEESRYEHFISEPIARDFIRAVTDPVNGVLTWLKKHW